MDISNGLHEIVRIVVKSYGKIEAEKLVDLTHEEEPWINTAMGNTIELEMIKNYFNKVYSDVNSTF